MIPVKVYEYLQGGGPIVEAGKKPQPAIELRITRFTPKGWTYRLEINSEIHSDPETAQAALQATLEKLVESLSESR